MPANVGRSCVVIAASAFSGFRRRALLEPEQPVRQHIVLGHLLMHALLDSARIFTDHHGTSPLTFQRDDPKQVIGPIPHVGAVLRWPTLRNPPEPKTPFGCNARAIRDDAVPYGVITILMQPSNLRLKMSNPCGASSSFIRWVTTKRGSMSPLAMRSRSGLK